MGSKTHFLTKYYLHKRLIILFFQQNGDLTEQQNRSAIIVLAPDGYTPKDIVKLTKLPKATVYRIFKQFKSPGLIEKNTKLEVILSAPPGFSLASNALLKLTHPHSWQILQRNAMCSFPKSLELSIGPLVGLAIFEDAVTS